VRASLWCGGDSSQHARVSLHESWPAGCEPACHGCRHRGWSAERSLAQKNAYLGRVLERWADRLQPVASVGDAERLGYRDRVSLTSRWDAALGWRFGLMRRDELIAIHDCPVHTPRVNAFVRTLVETLPPFAALPLAYVHVAGAQATLIVKARRHDPGAIAALVERMPATGLDGLWVHCHPSAGRRMFARSGWTLAWGVAESRDSSGLHHGPAAFQQLLPRLHERAMSIAVRHLAPDVESAVLDLYCGIGASMRRWRAAGAAVLGVELAGGAVEQAPRNAPGAQALRGTCVQRLPQIADWWNRQPAARHVYVNPPRSGLEAQLAESIAHQLRPQRMAYLSCSAGTLARDLAYFETAGYVVDAIHPYDFFPLTHHVETMALLSDRVR
jgi:23S rRNA (uracil1939-C5)-methyltransferase